MELVILLLFEGNQKRLNYQSIWLVRKKYLVSNILK